MAVGWVVCWPHRAEHICTCAPVLRATKLALQRANTKTRLEVDFSGDGGCPCVVPIRIVRRKFLERGRLHDVCPLRQLAEV